ncbi:MAG: MotA/TolQ/ExbB proton channel family protein [Lentisphaerales bacterium]|nr:MotA/TolQ/ExbB proton channel family protein [Lentisphaerales bacterium]
MKILSESLEFWQSAGWFAGLLLLLSVISWFWLLSLYLKLRQSSFRTSKYEAEITERLQKGESSSVILDWLSKQAGIVPCIISYVFAGNRQSSRDIKDRYLEASGSEISSIEREFGLLNSMVTAAPLLGLLGTVVGMVETFRGLSNVSGMEVISSGISKALLTTQLGLIIALPGIFGLVYLKRKFGRLVLELDRLQFHIKALIERPVV